MIKNKINKIKEQFISKNANSIINKVKTKPSLIIISILVILATILYITIDNIHKQKNTTVDLSKIVELNQIDTMPNRIQDDKHNTTQDVIQNKEQNQIDLDDDNKISPNSTTTTQDQIIIHITGEIKNKGIVTLTQGARIADAIKAAGGETKQADLNQINLAYELQDGQKIYIPNKKDKQKDEAITYITSESGNNNIKQENSKNTTNSPNKGGDQKVDINQANQSELETLPGIGESIANRIIEYRNQNGKFQNIEEIQNVKGIGNSKYNNIKDKITVK